MCDDKPAEDGLCYKQVVYHSHSTIMYIVLRRWPLDPYPSVRLSVATTRETYRSQVFRSAFSPLFCHGGQPQIVQAIWSAYLHFNTRYNSVK